MRHTFKKALLSLAVIAVCSSLQFTSCKKKGSIPNVTSKAEFQALKDFYKATGGENWTKKWDTTNTDITTWYGVTMSDGESFTTDQDGTFVRNIVAISLPNNNLSGSLPASLINLSDLKELNLSNNTIGGEIPASLDKLRVSILNLSNNNFTGNINSLFSNYRSSFSSIKNIDITNNLFSGDFPFALAFNIANNYKITLDESATDINVLLAPVLPYMKLCPQKGDPNLTGINCFQ